jgi:AraC-like DNA-binding protein
MSNLKSELHNNFPFLFVYKDTKSPQKELSNHMHDYYEIVYVYGGKGTFFIGDIFHEMNQGDVFLIPNNTIHRARPDRENPVTSTILFFSPMLIYKDLINDSFSYFSVFDVVKKSKNYKITLQSEQKQQIEKLLIQLHEEVTNQEPGSKHYALLIIHQMMIELYRTQTKSKERIKDNTYKVDWIADILLYINEHLHKPLSLTTLADKCLVSPSHFSRVFKETTGIGLTVYINTKRIIKSQDLLLETNYTISHIAEMCGFESNPHFYRMFKKYMNTTPASYRKKNDTSNI